MGHLWVGEEEHGLDAAEVLVHGGNVALVLEVFHRTESAQDEPCFFAACEVDGEVIVGHDLDARLLGVL